MGTLRAPCIQLRSISFRLGQSPCILPPSLTNLPTCRRGASRQDVATIILELGQERGFGDLFDRSNSTVKTYQQKKKLLRSSAFVSVSVPALSYLPRRSSDPVGIPFSSVKERPFAGLLIIRSSAGYY